MMKIFGAILFVFTLATTATAQNSTTSKKGSWGFKTGLNISNLRVSNGTDGSWKTGPAAGFFFNIKADHQLSFQPEFLYSSMGGKDLVANSGNSLRLNYFSVPLLLKYRIKNSFSIVAGAQIDVLIAAKTKNSSNQFAKVTDSYKEDSYNGTAGFEFWPTHCLGVTGRYIYGFNNINNTSSVGNPELKNQGVQIMVALKL